MKNIRSLRWSLPINRLTFAVIASVLALTGILSILTLRPSDAANAQVAYADPGCAPGSFITHGPTDKPWVSLTIDDGPNSFDSAIMDAFDANGQHGDADFFEVGNQVRAYPAVSQEVVNRGFGIANHSVTHQYKPSVIAAEWEPNQNIIAATTGITPVYGRSPGLTTGPGINEAAGAAGLCNVSISLDSLDTKSPAQAWPQLCANIRAAKPGDIILFHSKAQTMLAFQNCVFQVLREKGLEPVLLHQLLTGADVPSTRITDGQHVEIQAGAPGQTVVGQLTVDGAQGAGFLKAYACSDGEPATSDLNYVAGEPISNAVYVKADVLGKICVSVHGAATNIIFDQTAEVSAVDLPIHAPVRMFDSREGFSKLVAGQALRLKLAGPSQIVIGQVTNDQADQPGFITAYTCDAPLPGTSNLNYVPGRPSSNRFVVQANAAGEVCFYSYAATHIIVDQSAELVPTAMTFEPARLTDTRLTKSALPDGGVVSITTGLPNQTVIGQLTVDNATGKGFATIYPCDKGLPNASNVNYATDRPRSSSVIANSDASGTDCVYVYKGTDVIFDKFATAPWASHAPVRMLDTRTTVL